MEKLRRKIAREEFDYLTLMDCLQDYARPRDKVTALLKSGAIVRVKKGLYIFGPDYSRAPYSREVLANLVYGPSHISLDYALSYYGLIPERVETVTSVTCRKNRTFSTPEGRFTYWAVPLSAYSFGIDLVPVGDGRAFLMATREKALTDKICQDRGTGIRRMGEFEGYLFEHLRIDPGELARLDVDRVGEISLRRGSRKVQLLASFLRRFLGVAARE